VTQRWTHGNSQYAEHFGCCCVPCEDSIEGSRMRRTHLPAEPLLRFVELHYPMPPRGMSYASQGGVAPLPEDVQRAIYRAKQDGWVTEWCADELATRFGVHPRDLWPQWDPMIYADQLELNSPEFRSLVKT
jgi:hypothetical protein